MDDENEFVEVSIISNTVLPIEKMSPFKVEVTTGILRLLQGLEPKLIKKESRIPKTADPKFDPEKETEGILTFLALDDRQTPPILEKLRLTATELRGIAEYQTWVLSEPAMAKMGESFPVQLQRVAGPKQCFIAATEANALFTNGKESKLITDASRCVVLWGNHYFAIGGFGVSVYDLNFQKKLSMSSLISRIESSAKMLVFRPNGVGLTHVRVIDRTFESLLPASTRQNADPDADLEKFTRYVEPEASSNRKKQGDLVKEIHCVSFCPHSGELVFIIRERKKFEYPRANHEVIGYIQRGKETTSFTVRYSSELYFEPLYSSYSGKWYLITYPRDEPQEKTLFLFDQKSLSAGDKFDFNINPAIYASWNWTLHFLKPQKLVFPFLVFAQGNYFLYCEFRNRVYKICGLQKKSGWPEAALLTHLSGRVWLCLPRFTKAYILAVDTDKLCKLLRLN